MVCNFIHLHEVIQWDIQGPLRFYAAMINSRLLPKYQELNIAQKLEATDKLCFTNTANPPYPFKVFSLTVLYPCTHIRLSGSIYSAFP
jgi:hypothetical protein